MVHKKIGRSIVKAIKKVLPKKPPRKGGGASSSASKQPALSITIVDKPKRPPRRGGRGTPSPAPKKPALSITIVDKPKRIGGSGLTRVEKSVLLRREALKVEAKRRKKVFTRLEAERFLGGGSAVAALRRARKKGFRIVRESAKKRKEEEITKKILPPKIPIRKTLQRTRLRTKIERGEKLTLKEEAKLGGLTASQSFIEAGKGVVVLSTLPFKAGKGVVKLIRNPKNIKKVPKKSLDILKKTGKGFKEGGEKFGRTLRVSPTEAIAVVGTEILLFKGTGKALKLTGKLSSEATTQLIKTTPKFAKVEKGKIIVKSEVPGKNIVIKVVEKPVKKTGIPLKEQIKLDGRKITVVSAQADRIVNLLKTKRVIRKPIPNEAQLKTATKNLLNKFDRGRITKKQLIQLDRRIRRETGREGSLLERSFFGSPGRKLRISRLGEKPRDATLLDILAGDVTFKTQKPQILIFEKSKVEKFPKALKNIEKKIRTGKSLTRNEANKLLQFQLKKSSKFKPIGALSKEPEVTLAPGEIIRKVKTIAFTEIRGRRIPIVRAEIIKPKPSTAKLLKKAREGKITPNEMRKLRSNLKKETGFKTS